MPLVRAEFKRKHRQLRNVLKHDISQVLYFPFDYDDGNYARDRSGYNNHGTIYGAVHATGKVGDALYFDGVNDYMKVLQSASLNSFADTDELSVGFWLNLEARPSFYSALVSMPEVDGAGFNLHIDPERFFLWLALDGTRTYILSFTYPDTWLNIWKHHFVAVKSGVSRWYVDGELLSSASHSANLTVGTGDLFINSGGGCWKGLIDEVRIYNCALSQAEIQRIMNMRGL